MLSLTRKLTCSTVLQNDVLWTNVTKNCKLPNNKKQSTTNPRSASRKGTRKRLSFIKSLLAANSNDAWDCWASSVEQLLFVVRVDTTSQLVGKLDTAADQKGGLACWCWTQMRRPLEYDGAGLRWKEKAWLGADLRANINTTYKSTAYLHRRRCRCRHHHEHHHRHPTSTS